MASIVNLDDDVLSRVFQCLDFPSAYAPHAVCKAFRQILLHNVDARMHVRSGVAERIRRACARYLNAYTTRTGIAGHVLESYFGASLVSTDVSWELTGCIVASRCQRTLRPSRYSAGISSFYVGPAHSFRNCIAAGSLLTTVSAESDCCINITDVAAARLLRQSNRWCFHLLFFS